MTNLLFPDPHWPYGLLSLIAMAWCGAHCGAWVALPWAVEVWL